jgi:hypothetical protein
MRKFPEHLKRVLRWNCTDKESEEADRRLGAHEERCLREGRPAVGITVSGPPGSWPSQEPKSGAAARPKARKPRAAKPPAGR